GVLKPQEGPDHQAHHTPDQVVKGGGIVETAAQHGELVQQDQAVGPPRQPPGVVDQGHPQDLVEADGGHQQVVAPQVDDGAAQPIPGGGSQQAGVGQEEPQGESPGLIEGDRP